MNCVVGVPTTEFPLGLGGERADPHLHVAGVGEQ